MRWGPWTLATALVLAGCGGDESDGERPSSQAIERIDVDAPLTGPLVALGDVLLAGSEEAGVFRSSDLGSTWDSAELPGAPPDMELDSPELLDGVVVVTGFVPVEPPESDLDRGDLYVWTSRDGVEWRGGRLPSDQRPSNIYGLEVDLFGNRLVAGVVVTRDDGAEQLELLYSADDAASWSHADWPDLGVAGQVAVRSLWQTEAGPLVAQIGMGDLGSAEEQSVLLQSDDSGATWRVSSCPAEALLESGGCVPVETVGTLRIHGSEVSLDGDATWQSPRIEPPFDPELHESGIPGDVVATGDGWLATGSLYETGDQSHGVLLRSRDGVLWERLLAPDPCHEGDVGRPNSSVFDPVQLGDRRLVAYSCVDLTAPLWSDLYLLAPDGSDPVALPDAHLQLEAYLQPVVVGDTAVVPVRGLEDDEGTVALVRVRP